ncbi:histidine phosphatase family protein [Methylobacterium terricola]|uniref:Histidine phosphatase family protein n=1 Tax=Methylobacterium terricola TaxID=2583531 RepID=A0A5C4L7M1_9HYPH|nr:histidine phosphatase family protein [Methylobacterium terricola]TNC07957.1 histidine phosphatase family protein [Methylobacterium terricola]
MHAHLIVALALVVSVIPASATEAVWAAARAGGTVMLLRHANAPGFGDPADFRLGACETQRNLGEAGRAQAAELGLRLRRELVVVTAVRSSRWCRARDTAALAFPDVTVEADPSLDSFFVDRKAEPDQSAALRDRIRDWLGRPGTLVLVTHQVNITALTGIVPADGEITVLRPNADSGFDVVGRLRP